MSFENAKKHIEKYNLSDKIKVFDVSSATVALAAQAIGCEEARIAKTLSFYGNDGAILIVAAGDARTDNRKFKDTFGMKAKMLSPEDAKNLIGHEVGGICPFGIKETAKVHLDKSLKRFDTVYPACGSSNSAVELTIAELEKVSEYVKWVDVCKQPEGE